MHHILLAASAIALMAGTVTAQGNPAATPQAANPLLADWTGPYGGVPPWDKVKPELFPAAFEASLAERAAEYRRIADNPAAPTFANTFVPMQLAGQRYGRVMTLFGVMTGNMNTPAYQALDREWSPKFSAASDAITFDPGLFARIEAVYRARAGLDPQQQRLVTRTYDSYVRQGAKLTPAQKTQLSAYNQELASAFSDFSRRLLADENSATVVTDEAQLAGVPDSVKAVAKAAAAERGQTGWAIVNTRSAVDPVLTFATDRALREKVWRAFVNRGDNGDANDTNATIARIVKLRADRAHLLGFRTHADWRMQDTMAKTPAAAMDLMMRVWHVTDRAGREVGLFYRDDFARSGKRSGAWANTYRGQRGLAPAQTVLSSNNNNFAKGATGEPVLISLDDAQTLFHEFGHAIHAMLQNVTYPGLAGTPRDFVEYPSQVNEHWLLTRDVLDKYARHYQTGAAMPQALLDKIEASKTFNQGFATSEYLSSAIVDMKLHTVADGVVDPDAFERTTLTEIGMPRELVMRHRLPQFNHLFSSDSYSAGYYSYLWSETMDADTFAAFEEAGSPWDKPTADRFARILLSTGNETDRAAAYRAFRGRDPDVNALLKKRGFPTTAAQ